MSKQVSAEDVFKQGLGDRYQTSDNFEGLLENAVATPINENEDINGLEEASTTITATGQKPDLITVDEWAEKRGYEKPKETENENDGDASDNKDDKKNADKDDGKDGNNDINDKKANNADDKKDDNESKAKED